MAKKKRVYFAHPMGTYGSPLEEIALELIGKHFPESEYEIVNPAEHQPAIRGDFSHFQRLVGSCDEFAFLPFPDDGKIGYGIQGEMQAFRAQHPETPVHEIDIHAPGLTSMRAPEQERLLTRHETQERNRRSSPEKVGRAA